MKRGKRIFIGNMDDLSRTKAQLELMSNNNNKMIDLLISYPNVGELKADGNIVVAKLMNDATAEDVNSFLHQNGVFLNHLVLRKANLESQVLDLLKDN
jgi:ABC-2 type transport system ATP-binding protein